MDDRLATPPVLGPVLTHIRDRHSLWSPPGHQIFFKIRFRTWFSQLNTSNSSMSLFYVNDPEKEHIRVSHKGILSFGNCPNNPLPQFGQVGPLF